MQTDLERIYTFQRIRINQETRIFSSFPAPCVLALPSSSFPGFITLASSYLSHCSHTDGILRFSSSPSCLRDTWNALSSVWSCLLHRFILTHSSKLSSYVSFSRKPSCHYKSKANRYKKWLTYLKNRVTTNQKHTINSQKPGKREHKYNTKENHQTTKGETKRKQRDKEEI